MVRAVLSLGSNIGNRKKYIDEAIKIIENTTKINIQKISSYYETKPYGVKDFQCNYINCCVEILTDLNPFTLLGVCLGIESSLGRKRPYRFSPRTIDIDLIFYGNEKIESEDLILPHPRTFERAFVLIPMQEIFPSGYFENFNFLKWLETCDNSGIEKV